MKEYLLSGMASARPRKFPSANWSVPLTLSAMDLGMSSGLAAGVVAEFCGVADFPIADRAMPHMIRRAATRKRLILASGIREKGYLSHRGKSNVRLLALVVRKGSNFECVFCGLSPPVSPRHEMVSPVYPMRRCETGSHDCGGAAEYP